MMIKKFKDSLTDLKTILDKIDKIKIIKRLETNQIEETTNKELKELEIKKIDELEKFYAKLGFRSLNTDFWKDQTVMKKKYN